MQQALDSAAKKPPMKMRPSRAAAARASGLLKETPVPPEHVTVGYGAFRAALKGTSDDSGATGATAVLEAPRRAPPQQEMLPLSRRPDMRASLARLVEPVSSADSAAPSSGAGLAGHTAAPSVEHQPAASQAEPSVSSRQASHEAASSSGRSVQPDFSKLSGDQLQASLCSAQLGLHVFISFPVCCTGPSAAEEECNLVGRSMLLFSKHLLQRCCALCHEKGLRVF